MPKKYDYAIVIILFFVLPDVQRRFLTFADDSKGCGSAACK
jgi:hypothetical protein